MRGGPIRLTASGALIASGKRVRIFDAAVTSGAIAGQVKLRHGALVTDTIFRTLDGEPNKTIADGNWPSNGVYFSNGCYVELDANATAVEVNCMVE